MHISFKAILLAAAAIILLGGTAVYLTAGETSKLGFEPSVGPNPTLPQPTKSLIPTVKIAKAVGWLNGEKPAAAQGLSVTEFASDVTHVRWLLVLPNGDVLAAQSNAPNNRPDDNTGIKGMVMGVVMKKAGAGVQSPDQISLLRDTNGDGVAEVKQVFLSGLHSPLGMALVGNNLYVADTDKILRFPYKEGDTSITAAGEKVTDLPAGTINHHWTKGLVADKDGKFLYASVGSNSNVAENGIAAEKDRAAILQVEIATGAQRVFASGLRNPVGMAWEPQSGALWAVVNERDELGSDLVPDYLTSVKEGTFYGWPYSYYGQHVDDRVKPQNPEMVVKAIPPDYALGNHVAPLGLTFSESANLPPAFQHGAFIGEHGSWNRDPPSGYKVVFVPFEAGKPSGKPVDILTGFRSEDGKAHGRPVGVAIDKSGALLVADDVGSKVWRVTAQAPSTN